MIKVLIAGGRFFNDYELLKSKCDEILADILDRITVVSGHARGADELGEDYADEKGYEIDTHPAKWDDLNAEPCVIGYNKYGKLYNKLAGFNRNKEMMSIADIVICFWDGKSKGTKDTINLAKKTGKELYVINY
jgi:predicted Rossmann fold nucleotide-binding protein DprA/Smf involved in DNA uptake